MLTEYKTKINVGVGLGVVLMFGSGNLLRQPEQFITGLGMFVSGWALLLYGCANYAKAKGYSEWYGLFGLLLLPGVVVLALFNDRCKDDSPPTGENDWESDGT